LHLNFSHALYFTPRTHSVQERMTKLAICVLAAVFSFAASQTTQSGGGNNGGGGGGGQSDNAGWTGNQPQIKGKHCGELTPDDCKFIDEARQNCPQTCTDRDNGVTPAQQQQTNQPCLGGPKKCGGKKKGCFHGDDLVQTKEHGTIAMSKLASMRDAHVLTRNDDGELEYSSVRYWLHSQPALSMKFITLRTESGHQLAITSDHLIYETDCNGGAGHAIYAKNVQIDRCLYVKEAGKLSESRVVEKGEKKMNGIYSPITTTGSIVVNDVLASCYNYYENESLQKFVYQYMIGFQDALYNWLPSGLYEAAFNSQNGAVVAVPRLVFNFLQLSNYFVH